MNAFTSRPPTVLVVCATRRDRRELTSLGRGDISFVFHDYASSELEEMVAPAARFTRPRPVLEEIEAMVEAALTGRVEAVVSTDDYPGSTLAAILAARLSLPGTPATADLMCQHKYHSRQIQRHAQPDAVPPFALLEDPEWPPLPFPFLIKPVKSFFSVGAWSVDGAEALRKLALLASLPEPFFAPLDVLLHRYAGVAPTPSRVLAEGLLCGTQCTFEGYVDQGQVHPIGIVDSIFFPGTPSFQRFEYPSGLPKTVRDRIAAVTGRVLEAIGFSHGMFNIEFRYDRASDTLGIVEINPRMASQFADLYEKVDGVNTYSVLVDLALGRQPSINRGGGRHAMAASCVLRRFDDARVLRAPGRGELARIKERHPDARVEVLAGAGEQLSAQMQDGRSFRYGVVNLGGRDRGDILAAFDWCCQQLGFVFEPMTADRCRQCVAESLVGEPL